jgi:hypothetical protein
LAEDDKKSFWSSLPGILTALAAVLTAAGALIYHSQTKPKAKRKAAPVQQEATGGGTGSSPSANQSAPPEGFEAQASYNGDCASPPAGSVCIGFRDGYQWLVQDAIATRRKEVGSWERHQVLEASGKRGLYQHILGTQYVKLVPQ